MINKARDKDSKKLGKRGMRIGQDSTGASSPASTVDGMGRKGKRTRHSRAQSIDPDMGDRRKRVRTADNSPKVLGPSGIEARLTSIAKENCKDRW